MNSLGIPKPAAETRVVVAMSGGVDSSVAAALLAEQGFDVVGVTLQLYDHGAAQRRKGACCAGQDIHDARRVADGLGIAHYVLDYERRFQAAVIDDFADTYLRGETPVPCIRCNQRVKFRDLLETARDLGADALATGHYVRREAGAHGPELHRAADIRRDQSYFLFATTRAQLAMLRFPLGGLDKRETRALAGRFGLAVADKPDSQDICFVPRGSYAEVIARLRPEAGEPGDIVDTQGRVLGRHGGIVNFTVGQRRGIGVAGPEPLFVVRIEAAARRVVVGPRAALEGRRLTVRAGQLARRACAGRRRARRDGQAARPPRGDAGGPAWARRWPLRSEARRAPGGDRAGPSLRLLPWHPGARRRLDRTPRGGAGGVGITYPPPTRARRLTRRRAAPIPLAAPVAE